MRKTLFNIIKGKVNKNNRHHCILHLKMKIQRKRTTDVEKEEDSFITHKCKNSLTLWTATRKKQLLLKKPYNILLYYLTT